MTYLWFKLCVFEKEKVNDHGPQPQRHKSVDGQRTPLEEIPILTSDRESEERCRGHLDSHNAFPFAAVVYVVKHLQLSLKRHPSGESSSAEQTPRTELL